jgi:hypothetical protein
LHAIPKSKNHKDKTVHKARLSVYGVENETCALPDADSVLVNDFHNLGYKIGNGDNLMPLTWLEIASYSSLRHSSLSMWESEQLVNMSREYCNWLIKARDINCQSPWHSEKYNVIEATSTQVTSGFAALKAMAQNKNKSR